MSASKIIGVTVPPAREGSTRPMLDQVLAAAPRWLLGLAVGIIALLPASSRLRRRVLQQGMSHAWAAANRGDWWFMQIMYEPDCELIVATEFQTLGLADRYRGHGGPQELADAWRNELPDVRWDPEHLIDLGDRWVLRARVSGSGRKSRARVDRTWGSVYHLSSRGRIARQDIFWTWEETIAAERLHEGG